MKTPLKIWY